MKTLVKPELVQERKERHITISKHYSANCPFCEKSSWFWPSENETKLTDGTNKCRHFEKINSSGWVVFSLGFDIKIDQNRVYINDVIFGLNGIKGLICDLENYLYERNDDWLESQLCKINALSSQSSGYRYPNDRVRHLIDFLRSGPAFSVIDNFEI